LSSNQHFQGSNVVLAHISRLFCYQECLKMSSNQHFQGSNVVLVHISRLFCYQECLKMSSANKTEELALKICYGFQLRTF